MALGAKEHVLGAAEADPFGAELAGAPGVLGGVGIGADAERARLVGPGEHRVERLADLGLDQRHVVAGHRPGAAVDRDPVPGPQDDLAAAADLALLGVDFQRRGAGHGGDAHAAGDQRRVRGLAALRGEDADRGVEAGDVVGLGEGAGEDHVAPLGGGLDRDRGGEDDLPLRRPGRGGDAGGDDLVGRVGVEGRVEQRVEGLGVDRHQRRVALQQALRHRVDGEPHRRLRRALRVARLQHVEAAFLDRELGVLHVAVVALQRAQDVEQLRVHLRLPGSQLADVARRPHPGDDVLALGVGQEVPGGLGRAGHLVAAEGDAGAGSVALVAEDHLLHVHRGAPAVGDAVDPSVGDRALAGPGVEDGADRGAQLGRRIGREVVELLESGGQRAQAVGAELGVLAHAALALLRRDQVLEALALDPQHHVPVHLHEAAVGVPGEALVAGAGGEAGDRGVVQAQVEDGVEHPRHRLAGARADRDQQRVLGIAEPLAGLLLEPHQGGGDLVVEPGGELVGAHVGDAGLGGDREARRDAVGAEDPRHLGDVGALAAEQVAHLP